MYACDFIFTHTARWNKSGPCTLLVMDSKFWRIFVISAAGDTYLVPTGMVT